MIKFLFLFVFSSWQLAHACSCAEWGSPAEMLKDSDGAFLVIPESDSVSIGRDEEWGEDIMETKFSVIRSYKGPEANLVSIRSVRDTGGNCGMSFVKNESIWLIFTYQENGVHHSNGCMLSGAQSDEDIAFIRGLNSLSKDQAETF